MDAEAKACALLEHLIDRLHDAAVDYQCRGSSHEFFVFHAGSRFTIRFTEQSLLTKCLADLYAVLAPMVERIRVNSARNQAPPRASLMPLRSAA
jgi:hypothetical protein